MIKSLRRAAVGLVVSAVPAVASAQVPAGSGAGAPAQAAPAQAAPGQAAPGQAAPAQVPAGQAKATTAVPASGGGKTGSWAPKKKEPPPPPPPDVAARLVVVAPGPNEAWTMRLDNEGDRAIRVPADVRLLSFEIEVPANDPKNPKKKPTVFKCAAPDAMKPSGFPAKRGLLLAPGQSYVERFDPRLFCFGKNAAALVGSAKVKARFGWDPPPKWSLAAKKGPVAPFAAEGTDNPAVTTPLRQLTAPTILLSYGMVAAPVVASAPPAAAAAGTSVSASTTPPEATPATTAPAGTAAASDPVATAPAATSVPSTLPQLPAPAIVDANAPRLAVTSSEFSDASAPRSASVTVTVKNAGARSMVAALRPRMASFEVAGPDHSVLCAGWPATHAIPREHYREYKAGGSTSFTVLLAEVCPDNVFTRPGLYSVKVGFWANESGEELGVDGFTGRARAKEATLLRLVTSREPFYRDPPKAVPTPQPQGEPTDEGETQP